jgi:effector-binding domain-containing protein
MMVQQHQPCVVSSMIKTVRMTILALAVTAWGVSPAMATEEPAFTLVQKQGNFEIRDYAPVIVAEVTLQGGAERARNAGFQPLADYIFAKDRKGPQIAMTAPVTQAPREQIAMTAPVTQRADSASSWTVGFTMPAKYTMETLPAPVNPNVKLIPHPAKRMAVVRFSGTGSAGEMEQVRGDLMKQVATLGLTPVGAPVFAFYDPPWTLPFFRRNEVMVELAQP